MFKQVINNCQELLYSHPAAKDALEYLNSRIDPKIAVLFELGWFPSSKFLGSLFSVLSEAELLSAKLMYYYFDELVEEQSPIGFFSNHNLIMPFNNAYGEPVGLVGRSILSDAERKSQGIAKYKNTKFNKGHHLFGLDKAKDTIIKDNYVFIVEGQFDCIKAFEAGIKNVVALGSSSLSFEQMTLILRYTDNVILLLDNDDAGNLGAERAIKQWSERSNIQKGSLPLGYKDLFEFIENENIEAEELKRIVCK